MAIWPEDEQHDSRIDGAIDEAARRMTDGAPGIDLRAHVLARIDERESSPRGRRLAWIVSPIAAAAIIFLIIVARLFQGHDRGAEDPARQPPAVTRAGDERLGPTPTQPDAHAQTTHPPTLVRLKPDTTYEIQNRPRIAPSAIEALAPESLDVESIRLAALPPADSIRVEPLETIVPIDVAPLGPPEIDDPQRRE